MKTRAFDRITREVLDPLLIPLGFEFRAGAYFRNLDSKVRHVVILDFDVNRGRFIVMIGLNSSVLDQEATDDAVGAYVTSHMGNRRPLPAHDVASATKSLERTRVSLEKFGLPWLEQCASLEQLAVLMPDDLDLLKGRLFLEAVTLSPQISRGSAFPGRGAG